MFYVKKKIHTLTLGQALMPSWLVCRGADYAPRLRSTPRAGSSIIIFLALSEIALEGPRGLKQYLVSSLARQLTTFAATTSACAMVGASRSHLVVDCREVRAAQGRSLSRRPLTA